MAWIEIPDLSKGVNFDATPEEMDLGVASGGKNVRSRAGYVERFHGMQTVFTTPLIAPYSICHFTVGTNRYVVYTGTQKTYYDDATAQVEITNGARTGGVDDRWCAGVFNGVYFQSNGVDVPQYWGGTGTLQNLTGWPADYKAGFMRAFGNNLVCGDITRGGVRERGTLLWSDTADPGTLPASWDIADASTDAGDEPLAETNGTLIDCLPLGDMNVVYKDDALHFMQRVQSNQIYRFGRLPGDTGLLARGCIAQYPGGHVYLGPNFDVLTHAGQGIESILEGRMRSWLASNINSATAQRSFLVTHPRTHEVLICFPSGSSTACDTALVWNYRDNTFSQRDLSNVTAGSLGQINLAAGTTWANIATTWATETREWATLGAIVNEPRLILARTDPKLVMFDSTEQDAGSDFTATWERTGMHFGSPERVKMIRAVQPRLNAAAGTVVKIQVGASMTPDVAPTWSAAVSFTVGTDTQANTFATGKYLALRIFTTAATAWRGRGVKLDVVPMGGW
jgi:hypothetical protein